MKQFAEVATARLAPMLEDELGAFLDAHGDQTFYVFALDFDAGSAAVYLSANTEVLFEQQLRSYQEGPRGWAYRYEEGIRSLRYSCGEWGHASFQELDLLTTTELDAITESTEEFEAAMLDALAASLVRLREGDTWQRMRKSPGFMSFAIGHDEDYSEALLSHAQDRRSDGA